MTARKSRLSKTKYSLYDRRCFNNHYKFRLAHYCAKYAQTYQLTNSNNPNHVFCCQSHEMNNFEIYNF
jgi:hypothetical protein